MIYLFWGCASLIAYSYLGYPLWLWLRSIWRSSPVRTAPFLPSISILIAVHNEAAALPRKLRNLAELDYPAELLQLVVVSDGSDDATEQVLAANSDARLTAVLLREHRGKAVALNAGVTRAQGEIVVFADVRQQLEPRALRFLAANFADPAVGCVSGELMLGAAAAGANASGVGLYWSIEKKVRQLESLSGSVVGATGAIYAVRKELVEPVPEGTILDDVYIPMQVAKRGARVIFEPRAKAWDVPWDLRNEFRRKIRTLSGNYQLMATTPWLLLGPNPLWFEFVSHKLSRLLVPFALVGCFLGALLTPEPLYRIALLLQLLFYATAVLAVLPVRASFVARLADAAFTFVVLNTAALVAFFTFVSGRRPEWSAGKAIRREQGGDCG